MADIASLTVDVQAKGVAQTTAQLQKLGEQSSTTEKQTTKLAESFAETERQSTAIRGGFRAMRGSTQMISYQLQDIAVQAQMGTDGFRILAQQGPQLASVFGPQGAVLGVMIAFGAMIGGTLVQAFSDADLSADELKETLDRLSESAARAENGTFELATRILELARVSEQAATARLLGDIADAKSAVQSTTIAIRDLANETLDFVGVSAQLRSLPSMLEKIKEKGLDVNDLFYGDFRGELAIFQSSLKGVAEEFGFTRGQALRYLEALGQLDPGDLSTYENFRKTLERIGIETEFADEEFRAINKNFEELLQNLDDGAEFIEFTTEAFKTLRTGGAEALKAIVEGSGDAAEALADMEQRHFMEMLRLDQKELANHQEKEDKKLQKKADRIAAAEALEQRNLMARLHADQEEVRAAIDKEDRIQSIEEKAAQEALTQLAIRGMSRIDQIKANAALEIEEFRKMYSGENEDLLAFELAKQEIIRQSEAEISFIREQSARRQLAVDAAIQQMALSRAAAVAGELSSMMSDAYGEQSAAAKIMFAAQKALAMAQIIVSTEQAAMAASAQSAALGGLAGFLSTQGAIRAMGMASLGIVAGQTLAGLTGRATGGQVRGGQSYLVGERGPELLTMGGSGRISSNDQLKQAIGGGGGITVVNNVDARGADASVDQKIRLAMKQTSESTTKTIQDLMRRRRFV